MIFKSILQTPKHTLVPAFMVMDPAMPKITIINLGHQTSYSGQRSPDQKFLVRGNSICQVEATKLFKNRTPKYRLLIMAAQQ